MDGDVMEVRRNYCTNPSFETDTNGDGTPDGVFSEFYSSVVGTPVFSRVAGRNGGYALRIQYTGVAGDVNKTLFVALSGGAQAASGTAAGSFAQNDPATASFHAKGTVNGLTSVLIFLDFRTAACADLNSSSSSPITIPAGWGRFSHTLTATGATTSRVLADLRFSGIDAGDTIDVTIDDDLIEKSAVLGDYFDGSMVFLDKICAWLGAPNASWSTETPVGAAALLDAIAALGARIDVVQVTPHVGDYTPSLVDDSSTTYEGVLDTLPDGTLVHLYREGSVAEGNVGNSGRVMLRKSTDDGATWRAPTVVYDDEYDDRNTAGGVIGSRIVVVFRRAHWTDPATQTGTDVDGHWLSIYSDDSGETWSAPLAGPANLVAFASICEIPGLGYAIPVYGGPPGSHHIGYCTTIDGAVWSSPTYVITDAGLVMYEPTMIYGDGLWLFACRSGLPGTGYTMCMSRDCGLTWSTPVRAANIPPWWIVGGCLRFSAGHFYLFGTNRSDERGVLTAPMGDPSDWFTWVYESTAARLAADIEDWTLVRSMLHPSAASTTYYYGYATATQRSDGSLLCIVTDDAGGDYPSGEDSDFYQFAVSGQPVIPQSASQAASADAKLDAVLEKTNTIGGAGAIPWPYVLIDPDGLPIAQAIVWVTTDVGGLNVIASGRTDDFGALTPVPHLDAGTNYFWAKKAGTNFDNPDEEEVVAP